MTAVLGFELRRRWKSPGAWLFLAAQLAVCGGLLAARNLAEGYSGFESLIRWSARALMIGCPVLCWGAYTQDLKEDAWKHLSAHGAGPFRLAFSRLLAAWSVCLAMAILAFGEMAAFCAASPARYAAALCGAVAMFLEGSLLSGFCLWVESRSKKAWKAALASALILMGLYALSRAGKWLEAREEDYITSGAIAYYLCEGARRICELADAFLGLSDMEWLVAGVFPPDLAIYRLAEGCMLGCFAAARLMRRKAPHKHKRRAATVAAALAALLAVEIIAAAADLPAKMGAADATQLRAITPVEEAKEIIGEAADKLGGIRAMYFADQNDYWMQGLLINYGRLDSRFSGASYEAYGMAYYKVSQVTRVDAEQDSFLLLAGGDRIAVIPADRLYAYSYAYNAAAGGYQATDVRFAAQKEILAALKLLSDENAPCLWVFYRQYADLDAAAWQLAADSGMYVQKVYSIPKKQEGRPECVYIRPTGDLTEEERDDLIAFLKAGGGLIVSSDYHYGDWPNLFAVLEYCGMKPWGRVAIETKEGLYAGGYPYYLTPVAAAHEVTRFVAGNQLLIPTAHAIQASDTQREGLTRKPLLMTSADSYLKMNPSAATQNREDGDEGGPLAVAMAAEDGTMRAVWVGSTEYLSDNMATLSPANLYFWLGEAAWASGGELGRNAVDVDAPSIASARVSLSPARSALVAAAAVLPCLAALIVGLALAARRRKNEKKGRAA